MTIALIVSALAGMAIGLRARVLMTLPAIILAVIATIVISRGQDASTVLWAAAFGAIAVQIGYLCGSLTISIFREEVKTAPSPASAPANTFRAHTGLNIRPQSLD
jgi:chromate transport protein ChrA